MFVLYWDSRSIRVWCAPCSGACEVMFIKSGSAAAEQQERRGSVSNWFSSLRRGAGRRKREETTVPTNYGSLGRRKDGQQPRGKTRSAWDLSTVTRLVCILFGVSDFIVQYATATRWRETSFGVYPNHWINDAVFASSWKMTAQLSLMFYFYFRHAAICYYCVVIS